MRTLFDTAADRLPDELQILRETLYAGWGDEVLTETAWHNQIRVRACHAHGKAFRAFVDAGVLVKCEDGFRLDKDA